MGCSAEQVLKDALSLPPLDRASIIERLFQSFDHSPDPQADARWANEVDDRLRAYAAGKIAASPAEDVLARINAL